MTNKVQKSFFGNMKNNRFWAFCNVFGPDKVLEAMCKADKDRLAKAENEIDKKYLTKFELSPSNPDPARQPENENKETFNGSVYENAAPGYREVITENPTDGDGVAADVGSEPKKAPQGDKKPSDKPVADEAKPKEDDAGVFSNEKKTPKKKPDEVDEQPVAQTKAWGREVLIAKSYAMKRVVIGALYVPYDPQDPSTVDSHGHACLKEDIELAAYEFMRKMNIHNVDMQHNFISGYGYVVESYIAKYADPLFPEGTWVIGVKVTEDDVWDKIQNGEITGFSLAGHAHLRAPEEVI